MAAADPRPAAGAVSAENQESPAAGRHAGPPGTAPRDKPVCLIVLGMAGSGKTTFVQVSRRVWLTAASRVS